MDMLSSPVDMRIAAAAASGQGMQMEQPIKVEVKDLHFFYANGYEALKGINLKLRDKTVTAFIGHSGCGKSTLLRVLIRMRSRFVMVFEKPTPFPMSIYENIAFGIRLYEMLPKSEMDGRVEAALRKAALWDEVKDKIQHAGLGL